MFFFLFKKLFVVINKKFFSYILCYAVQIFLLFPDLFGFAANKLVQFSNFFFLDVYPLDGYWRITSGRLLLLKPTAAKNWNCLHFYCCFCFCCIFRLLKNCFGVFLFFFISYFYCLLILIISLQRILQLIARGTATKATCCND